MDFFGNMTLGRLLIEFQGPVNRHACKQFHLAHDGCYLPECLAGNGWKTT